MGVSAVVEGDRCDGGDGEVGVAEPEAQEKRGDEGGGDEEFTQGGRAPEGDGRSVAGRVGSRGGLGGTGFRQRQRVSCGFAAIAS